MNRALWVLTIVWVGSLWANGRPALAQSDTLPFQAYYDAFSNVYLGRWDLALRDYLELARRGQRGLGGPWLDSICYFTLVGECYYQMGNYPAALENYSAAMRVWLKYPQWLLRVQWPDRIQPARRPVAIPWGKPQRPVVLGHFPARMPMVLGGRQNIPGLGFISTERLVAVDVDEMVRCMAWSMRRYRQLRGPLTALDDLAKQVHASLIKRPIRPHHWSGAWMDLLVGLSLRMLGRDGEALGYLKRSLVAAGQYDHPLSAIALLELAEMAAAEGKFATAKGWFLEASYSAYAHEQISGLLVLPEALWGASIAHLLVQRRDPFPPLEMAIAWARRERMFWLEALLNTAVAELAVAAANPRAASAALEAARAVIVRRRIPSGPLAARFHHVQAMAAYQSGQSVPGDQALGTALGIQRNGSSKWLFHLVQLDQAYTAGKLTPRQAERFYEFLLREPTEVDWQWRPLESLTLITSAPQTSWENYFYCMLQRRKPERAIEVAELARRHRFLTALPLGGRLLGLRWLLHAPEDVVPQPLLARKRQLLVDFPTYEPAARRCQQMVQQLRQQPLVPQDDAQRQALAQRLRQLGQQGQLLELGLRHIGVRREPAPRLFPPPLDYAQLQRKLRPDQAVLIFFQARGRMHAFLITKKSYAHWRLRSPGQLSRQIAGLLQSWGLLDRYRAVRAEQLQDPRWKKLSEALARRLFAASRTNWLQGLKELVIVPEGPLWYLPFEALMVPDDSGEPTLLIRRVRVRYVPFASLALPQKGVRRPLPRTLVVVGPMAPGQPEPLLRQVRQRLEETLPDATVAGVDQIVPEATLRTQVDRLFVVADQGPWRGPVFRWNAVPTVNSAASNRLGFWLQLPWGVPEEVVWLGTHTPAATGLREKGTGEELFLLSGLLFASGAQTVLLARWNPGGWSSVELLREYLTEVQQAPAAQAWRRAVLVMAPTPVDPQVEPRLDHSSGPVPQVGHPFFWASVMVLDRTLQPPEEGQAQAP